MVINLLGGPGCGKSTVAAGIFHQLKSLGYSTELVTEYVKDIVYDNNQKELDDQFLISAQQNHRLHRLDDKVEIIVCDASLLNGVVYNKYHGFNDTFLDNILVDRYKKYENYNFLLPRPKNYDPLGRLQTISEAIEIDECFVSVLNNLNVGFCDLRNMDVNLVVNEIVMQIKKSCKIKNLN
jgi:predicted ATPase